MMNSSNAAMMNDDEKLSLIDNERSISNNAGNQQATTTRRRTTQQQQQQQLPQIYETLNTNNNNSTTIYASTFRPPTPESQRDDDDDESSKYHGRKLFGRVLSSSSWLFQQTVGSSSNNNGNNSSCNQNDENKKYYRDGFNEYSWNCSFGTDDENGIWWNRLDPPGTILSFMVWILIIYSVITVTFLAQTRHLPSILAMTYCTLASLSLASHAKTMFTDPGSVPESAVPVESVYQTTTCHTMCSHCQTFKPQFSHHCRICNRCVSRMDHHCPWMNNCIGAANLKHFILFLVYTWLSSTLALLIFAWNYFLCTTEDCTFSPILIQLVRILTVTLIGTLLFTSSMIMNVTYGVMTGIGTIDRLKKKANNTMWDSDEEPIPLESIFGVGGYFTWIWPVDPLFEDYDLVMGYSTPQRLLREQSSSTTAKGGGVNHKRVGGMDYMEV